VKEGSENAHDIKCRICCSCACAKETVCSAGTIFFYFLLCLNSILRLLVFTTSQLPTRLHYNT